MQNIILSTRIKERCKVNNFTIKALLAKVGMNRNTIYDMEKKNSIPSADKLGMIARELNCSVEYLLGQTDNPNNNVSDDELSEYLELLRNRDEMKMLFNLTKNATKEEVKKAVDIITDLLKKD